MVFSMFCVVTPAYADTVFLFISVHHKPTGSQTQLHSRTTLKFYVHVPTPKSSTLNCSQLGSDCSLF